VYNSYLQDLDYTKFINYLSDFAQTIYGRKAIAETKPIFSKEELSLNLDLSREIFYLINRQGLEISPVDDIGNIVERSKQTILSPKEVQIIIDFQSAISDLNINCDESTCFAKTFLHRLKPVN